jgi:hypothetical protein
LEAGLIALLAQQLIGNPSAEWLGRHAANPKIHKSGLWNTEHIDGKPLTFEQVQRLKHLIACTAARR